MSVSPDEIKQIAELASVSVDDESLPTLTKQIGDILRYVAQLSEVSAAGDRSGFRPMGDHASTLRSDTVNPIPMTLTPEQMAPEFKEGLYFVPGVSGLGDEP